MTVIENVERNTVKRGVAQTCIAPYCRGRGWKGAEFCKFHSDKTPAQLSRSLTLPLRSQLLEIPFLGFLSTFSDELAEGVMVDKKMLDSLESFRLIEPIVVERTQRWAYSLTELGRKTVVMIRSSGGKPYGGALRARD